MPPHTRPVRVHRQSRPASEPRARCFSRRAAPGGFTLIEAVVASVVFLIGVLGLQAASTVVAGQLHHARAQALSVDVAAARFEQFAHVACASPMSGSETFRGVDSEWQISPDSLAGVALSSQTIRFVRGTSRRADNYLGAFRCR